MKKTISIVSSLIKMMIRTAAENKKSDKAVLAKDLPTAVKFFVQCNFPNGHLRRDEAHLKGHRLFRFPQQRHPDGVQ